MNRAQAASLSGVTSRCTWFRITSYNVCYTKLLRKKLVASEKALQEFREREKILDVKGLSLGGATREIEQLTTSLIEAP